MSALRCIQARKQEQCSIDVSVSYDDADAAAEGVRLRVEMQRAVDEERSVPQTKCSRFELQLESRNDSQALVG